MTVNFRMDKDSGPEQEEKFGTSSNGEVSKAKTQTTKALHVHRVDHVFAFIDGNLDMELTLNIVADMVHLSPYHLHRIFKYITGETLNAYVTRQRMEKSAMDLLHHDIGISTLAYDYGYSDVSAYSKAFRKFFGTSPTDFKRQNPNRYVGKYFAKSKNGQANPDLEKYICIIDNLKKWIQMNAKIEIRETPKRYAVGLTHIGINGLDKAFGELIRWTTQKDLLERPGAKMGRIFHDSFKVTDPGKVRMQLFLTTDGPFDAKGKVSKLTLDPGKCILGRFEITPDEFEKSWTGLFLWMNENGHQKSSLPAYEIYHNDYREHPEGKFVVDLCIPIT